MDTKKTKRIVKLVQTNIQKGKNALKKSGKEVSQKIKTYINPLNYFNNYKLKSYHKRLSSNETTNAKILDTIIKRIDKLNKKQNEELIQSLESKIQTITNKAKEFMLKAIIDIAKVNISKEDVYTSFDQTSIAETKAKIKKIFLEMIALLKPPK